jgi:uncharacterized protein with GYD domain
MPTYISLLQFTDQGMGKIKDSPQRLEAARAAWQKAGAQLKEFYLTMGRFDAVVISEAPDDETAAKLALATAALGNVRTETLRAFPEPEYRNLIQSLP